MTQTSLPEDSTPLTPFGYMQETLSTWTDFRHRTQNVMMDHARRIGQQDMTTEKSDIEPLAGEVLRSLADMNLRHWENTARLLESLPSWITEPAITRGASLTDFFDRLQRRQDTGPVKTSPAPGAAPAADAQPAPETGATSDAAPAASAIPALLDAPDGDADALTQIKGIGPKLSARLNALGIFHFHQIAGWSDLQAEWIEDQLSFKGKVRREDWIGQARQLVA